RDAPAGAGQQRYLTATHRQLPDQASPPGAHPRRGSRHSRVTPEGASFEVWTVLGEQCPGKMPHLQGAADVRPVRVNGGWRNASISSPSASTKPTNANTKPTNANTKPTNANTKPTNASTKPTNARSGYRSA